MPLTEAADCTIGSRSALPVVTAGARRGSPGPDSARGRGGMTRIVPSGGDVSFRVDGMYCGSVASSPFAPRLATNVPPGAFRPCGETAFADGDERTTPGTSAIASATASTTAAAATRRPLLVLRFDIDVQPPLLSACPADRSTAHFPVTSSMDEATRGGS